LRDIIQSLNVDFFGANCSHVTLLYIKPIYSQDSLIHINNTTQICYCWFEHQAKTHFINTFNESSTVVKKELLKWVKDFRSWLMVQSWSILSGTWVFHTEN